MEYVIECSGQCLTVEKANEHLRCSGVEKVILSAPPKDDNIPMFVLGVNHTEYKAGTKIISNSSCTTNCVAPIAQILQRNFGIEEALMTTVHAVTASQKVVDCGGGKNSRNGRCALDNIILPPPVLPAPAPVSSLSFRARLQALRCACRCLTLVS